MSEQDTHERARVGLVGARGYTGQELLALIARHEGLELALASSRELDGQPLAEHVEGWPEGDGRRFQTCAPEELPALELEVCVLALPNGVSPPFVEALAQGSPDTKILDLSADHRFDEGWCYGWPERRRSDIERASRVANPGCYATGMQCALWPLVDVLEGSPHVFGVSGYSGAGTRPSPKNDPERLRENLMPYRLTGHTHEREVSRQLDHAVHFTPHVAPFFRGITLTISASLREPLSVEQVYARLERAWAEEPLVEVQQEIPLVRDAVGRHRVTIGGVEVADGGRRVVLVATLDNLLKGAATQAMQNINLLVGRPELESIPVG